MRKTATSDARLLWGVPALIGSGALGMSIGVFETTVELLLVVLGVLGLLAATWFLRGSERSAGPAVEAVAIALIVLFSTAALPRFVGVYGSTWSGWVRLVVAFVVLFGALWSPLRVFRRQVLVGMFLIWIVVLFLTMAVLENPDSSIDVQDAHQTAASLLFEGRNPYSDMVIKDGSPPEVNQGVIVGYSYPPVTLVTYSLAEALGDARFASVAAIVVLLSTVLIVAARSYPRGSIFPGVIAMVPFLAGIVVGGWTEPLQAALLVVSAATYRRWLVSSIFLGLAVASKQYMVLALVPIMVSVDTHRFRRAAVALGVAAATYVPFLLWDPRALWDALVGFQLQRLSRADASSVWSIGWEVPAVVALMVAVGACLIAWRRLSTPATILLGQAAILGTYFILAPNTFGNFWFLVAVIVVAAAALAERSVEIESDGPPSSDVGPAVTGDGYGATLA